jgi:hypothetical protein
LEGATNFGQWRVSTGESLFGGGAVAAIVGAVGGRALLERFMPSFTSNGVTGGVRRGIVSAYDAPHTTNRDFTLREAQRVRVAEGYGH